MIIEICNNLLSLFLFRIEESIDTDGSADSNVPEGVVDFDATVSNDLYAVSEYAMDVFNYYKEREVR